MNNDRRAICLPYASWVSHLISFGRGSVSIIHGIINENGRVGGNGRDKFRKTVNQAGGFGCISQEVAISSMTTDRFEKLGADKSIKLDKDDLLTVFSAL